MWSMATGAPLSAGGEPDRGRVGCLSALERSLTMGGRVLPFGLEAEPGPGGAALSSGGEPGYGGPALSGGAGRWGCCFCFEILARKQVHLRGSRARFLTCAGLTRLLPQVFL